MGIGNTAIADLSFGIMTGTVSAQSTTSMDVAAMGNGVIIVGVGANLSVRCP